MITLDQAKAYLNVDFPDNDELITIFLNGEIRTAEKYTGRNYTDQSKDTYEVMSPAVQNAVLKGIATNYVQRDDIGADGASNNSINASIYTYRMESIAPMF